MKIAASIPSLGCRDVPEQCSVVVRVEQVRTARDGGHQEQGQRGQDELAVDQGPSQGQEHRHAALRGLGHRHCHAVNTDGRVSTDNMCQMPNMKNRILQAQ